MPRECGTARMTVKVVTGNMATIPTNAAPREVRQSGRNAPTMAPMPEIPSPYRPALRGPLWDFA